MVGFVLVELLEVIARRGGEAELVADEVVEHGAGVAADGAVRFVGDDEVEVGGRKELLVFVVEEQRLDGGDDDLGLAPVVAVLLVDDGLVVVLTRTFLKAFCAWSSSSSRSTRKRTRRALPVRRKSLMMAAAVSVLPVPVAISRRKRSLPSFDGLLEAWMALLLIGAEEAEPVRLDEAGALGLVLPGGFRGVARALGEDDVVLARRVPR